MFYVSITEKHEKYGKQIDNLDPLAGLCTIKFKSSKTKHGISHVLNSMIGLYRINHT